MDFITIIYIVLTLILLYAVFKPRKIAGKPIPGPKGWPVVGMAFDVTPENLHLIAAENSRKYGDIISLKVMGTNIVILNSERVARQAFSEEPAKFVLNDRPYTHVTKHFFHNGQSIITEIYGFSQEHDFLRKTFTKGFKVYGDGVKVFEEKVDQSIQELMKRIEGFRGEEFEVLHEIRHSIINLISIFLQGEPLAAGKEDMIWDYLEALRLVITPKVDSMLCTFPFLRHLPGFYGDVHRECKRCNDGIKEEIFVKQWRTYDKTKTRGIVDFLFHQQNKGDDDQKDSITDEQIEGLIADIIIGGVFTTVSSLSSMILCLARHPEVQRKAQLEIRSVIGTGRAPTLQDKAKCPYVEALFMETQRYVTVSLLSVVHVCREDVELDGYTVEKGSLVFPNLWYIHHDENIWGDPWTFRPERFLDENGQLLPRSHALFKNFVAFSVGRRQCVGEVFARSRLFLYIASLLQRWTFVPSRDRCGSCDPRSDQYEIKTTTMPRPFFCRAE